MKAPDSGESVGRGLDSNDRASGEHPSLTRIAAFSDGVFAFAITLLVLSIHIPRPTDADHGLGLLHLLTVQWQTYFAYVLSFMLIGINWAHHRVMFGKFARADNTLVWLNLLYLMVGVAFMPIPTAVLGAWLGDSHANQVVAAAFYGSAAGVSALAYNGVWLYGAYGAKLTHDHVTPQVRRTHMLVWGMSVPVAFALTLIAFVNPKVVVAGFVVVILAYVVPLPRWFLTRRRAMPASK